MHIVAGAGLGFLLSVLWFDLMFDVQVRGHRDAELPPEVLTSIGAYYRRVTTDARPMNRLVAACMLVTTGALAGELGRGAAHPVATIASLALTLVGIGLAGARTVRNAVRLGGGTDSVDGRTALARSIYRDHLVCITAIAGALVLQIVAG